MHAPRHAASTLVRAIGITAVITAAVVAAGGHLAAAGGVLLAGALLLSYRIRHRARAELIYRPNSGPSADQSAAAEPVDLTMRREHSR